ncbi:hypothetical protein [Deinococcus saxicola]|uniref:hypothetical protein n=1 Tax=Deinococcus saxicola TaxID=249406 RepID=UPI003D1384D6
MPHRLQSDLGCVVVCLNGQHEQALGEVIELVISHRISPDMVQEEVGKQPVLSASEAQVEPDRFSRSFLYIYTVGHILICIHEV